MMKTQQQNVIENKSVVGSMNSLGSLAPFMGVDPAIQEKNIDDVDFQNVKY